jgi:ubiquinone/menaquinone biosynthesis C-methylase UbiE
MAPPRRITHAQELLDQPHQDLNQLEQSLQHVDQVNRWLGGDRSLITTLRQHLDAPLQLLDVGTGSAAIPRRLVRWARRARIPVSIRATDLHPQTLELARRACRDYPEIVVEEANALHLPYRDNNFTHALLTLTLHHFEPEQQITVVRELARVSRHCGIVSELERSWPNYLGARLLAITWWRRNRVTRHDGPLSVLRAFTPRELIAVAHAAGLAGQVGRFFFYRLVLTVALERRSASSTE